MLLLLPASPILLLGVSFGLRPPKGPADKMPAPHERLNWSNSTWPRLDPHRWAYDNKSFTYPRSRNICQSRYKEPPNGGLLAYLTDFVSLVPLRPGAWQSEQAISRSEQALRLGHY